MHLYTGRSDQRPEYQIGMPVPSNFERLVNILVPCNLALHLRHHNLKFDGHQALRYLMVKITTQFTFKKVQLLARTGFLN